MLVDSRSPRPANIQRARVAAAALLASLMLGGCANLAARVLPANNQTVDPAQVRKGRFVLDKAHASLLFEVNHLGFSAYVGRFNSFDASLAFDPATPALSQMDVTIDTASVDTNSAVLEEKLRGTGFFNSAKFPTARFVSTRVEPLGPTTGRVTGDLTIGAITRPVTLDVTFNGGAANAFSGAYTLGFSARGTFSRAAFGLDAWAPAVGDTVTLAIQAEFEKTK